MLQSIISMFNLKKIIFFGLAIIVSCNDQVSTDNQVLIAPEGMVWVEGKIFFKGANPDDNFAMPREKPAHKVRVDGFFIDITEVTNKQFKSFVDSTGYITIAERDIDWELLKSQLPDGTNKPHDSILQPGSLIFNKNAKNVVDMNNYHQWWSWKTGASWRNPSGQQPPIAGADDHPVVHIAYEDALAYCNWSKRRLPTEAEWEAAAHGKKTRSIYTWGNNHNVLNQNANTWQGIFPVNNQSQDGFRFISPVKSYPPNSIGLYDMLGNVWELTSDLYNINYYSTINQNEVAINPKGAIKSFNPSNPYQVEHVMKGGSYLCHESYCASYRISARMGVTFDSGSDHTGFRTVVTREMILNENL